MKTPILIAAIVAGSVMQAGVLVAQSVDERPGFVEIDTNGDGEVTQEEIATFRETQKAERFAALDTDGDGGISAEELAAAGSDRRQARAGEMLERLDANDDGLLQIDEMDRSRADRGFNRADADGSGGLSAEEYEDADRKMGRGGDRDGRGHRR